MKRRRHKNSIAFIRCERCGKEWKQSADARQSCGRDWVIRPVFCPTVKFRKVKGKRL